VETPQFRDFVLQTRPNSIAANLLKTFQPIGYPTSNIRDIGGPQPGVNKFSTVADGIPDLGTVFYTPAAFRNASQVSIRIDHELRPGKDRIYGSYFRTHNRTLSGGVRPQFDAPQDEFTYVGNLNYTHTFSANKINEVRGGVIQLVGRPDLRKLVGIHEYTEGPVMAAGDVKVTALRNLHPPITESFALKFEFPNKTIVFSGDTAYFLPLAQFARGADILVHEVMYAPALERLLARTPNAPTLMAHLKASHTLTDEVGRIASEAGVKTLVLSHLVPADDPSVTEKVWTDAVRETWKGDLVVAHDGMEIAL